MAGASGISIEHCIERARVAVECGADSIIAMPANGMGGGQETIDLYGALWDATELPVWIQNNKPPTGPTIPTPSIIRIINEVPGARLLKEESLLPGAVMTAVLEACGDKVESIMGGMGGRFLLAEYRRGGAGTMPAGHITEAHVAVWEALEAGGVDETGQQVVTDEARFLFNRILPSLNFEFFFGVTTYKQAFWRRGIIKTPVTRQPGSKPFDRYDGEELDIILDRAVRPVNLARMRTRARNVMDDIDQRHHQPTSQLTFHYSMIQKTAILLSLSPQHPSVPHKYTDNR